MKNFYENLDTIFEYGFAKSSITIVITIIVLIILNRLTNRYLIKKMKIKNPTNTTLYIRIKRAIFIGIGVLIIIQQIKPLQSLATTLLASGGIIAVVIGLASQEAASSLINGAMLYINKPFRIGDLIYVKSLDLKGKVVDMTLHYTVIETFEKTPCIVPNTILNKTVIENISDISDKKANYLFIDISYESNMDKAITIIQKNCMNHPLCIDCRSKKEIKENKEMIPVFCIDFKDSGIALRATVHSKNQEEGFIMLSDLRKSIKKEFDKEGIEIPYPTRTYIQKNSD